MSYYEVHWHYALILAQSVSQRGKLITIDVTFPPLRHKYNYANWETQQGNLTSCQLKSLMLWIYNRGAEIRM